MSEEQVELGPAPLPVVKAPTHVVPTAGPNSQYTWWVKCAQNHVAAMGKGPAPLGKDVEEVDYDQPPRRYPLPRRYSGPPLCWACGGTIPTNNGRFQTQYLVAGPPPSYDPAGNVIQKAS